MKQKLLTTVKQTLPTALWIGGSAAGAYVLTSLLQKPELAPYYGVLNLLLVLLNEYRKA